MLKLVPLAIFVLLFIVSLNKMSSYYFSPDHHNVLRNAYGMNPFPESLIIGDFLNQRAQPGDQVALFGAEPQLYVYTKMDPPTKHAYFTYLVKDTTTTNSKAWQQEFINDMERERPRFVVFFNHRISQLVHPNSDKTIFNWFNQYINRGYKRIGNVDMLGPAPNQTNYVFDDKPEILNNYRGQGQFFVDIFERTN